MYLVSVTGFINIYFISSGLMGRPLSARCLNLPARENSSFIIHGELREFHIFCPTGVLMSFHLFNASPYFKPFNNFHALIINKKRK